MEDRTAFLPQVSSSARASGLAGQTDDLELVLLSSGAVWEGLGGISHPVSWTRQSRLSDYPIFTSEEVTSSGSIAGAKEDRFWEWLEQQHRIAGTPPHSRSPAVVSAHPLLGELEAAPEILVFPWDARHAYRLRLFGRITKHLLNLRAAQQQEGSLGQITQAHSLHPFFTRIPELWTQSRRLLDKLLLQGVTQKLDSPRQELVVSSIPHICRA